MKKSNGLKTAAAVMMSAVMLCACANTPQAGSRGRVEDLRPASENTENTENPAAAEPGTTADPEQRQGKGSIVTEEVKSVAIRYYIGYNIATGDVISETIPCRRAELKGDDLDKMSEILPYLLAIKLEPDTEQYYHVMYDHLMDEYELIINDDLVLRIGNEYGCSVSGGDVFSVPQELYDAVIRITEEYNENNVYFTLDTDRITVTDMDGKELEITDQDRLDLLKSVECYTINADDDMFPNERTAYVLDLHNGDRLEVLFASVLGKFIYADGSYEYVYIGEMEDHLNKIFAE